MSGRPPRAAATETSGSSLRRAGEHAACRSCTDDHVVSHGRALLRVGYGPELRRPAIPLPRLLARPASGALGCRAMSAGDDLIALYWTTSGPVEVHFGREWSLFDLRDRCEQAARVGFSGIGLWHADLEHVLETRTLARGAVRSSTSTASTTSSSSSSATGSSTRRRAPTAADERRARCCSRPLPSSPAHHIKVGQHRGHGVRAASDRRGLRRALRRRGRSYTDAKIVYEFMPYDVSVNDVDTALAVVEGAERAERRARVRHVAPRQAAARAGRAAPHPVPVPSAGSSSATGRTSMRSDRARRGDQPPQAARRGRVPDRASTSPCSASSATTARGASRCSPRSCAASRSSRSSTAPTRRRSAQLAAARERSIGV